ncbi:MAG: ATP-binding cassette domain-containing protein, partial [Proteobacteria bacterium]|nr:ATP-binding cassette domain-containing protein [Pseudomonadota bacterium]
MIPTDALTAAWKDAVLIGGARTPFVDYNGAFALVSPIDLGIKAGREALKKARVPAEDIGTVICGSMAQASFDAYMLPRHIGLYSGVRMTTPAHLVQRVCGTGVEMIAQAADAVSLGRTHAALCVGAESMSRNPVAAYTHRGGFRMGQVEFKDFLWEALLDTSCMVTMGGTAENLAGIHGITREEVDAFAARSFARALAAQEEGFFDDEIVPVSDETFPLPGFETRGIKLRKGEKVTKPTADVGLVFQAPTLLPWANVLDNVLFPLRMLGEYGPQGEKRARELLALAGLSGFENRMPDELSGGMQQRVAICRGLVRDPAVLLMDEPFAALDALTRDEMGALLLDLWAAKPKAIVFITHSVPEAVMLADRVIVMGARPGRIVDDVRIDLPRPRNFDMESR